MDKPDQRDMKDDLKPCPFCGSTDVVVGYRDTEYMGFFFFACQNCSTQGPCVKHGDHYESRATEAWNTRAKEDV
jgi:Lar family restriction alleviation protein